MIPRILEPEVMDTVDEAVDYNAMDHSNVNRKFVDDLLAAISHVAYAIQRGHTGRTPTILDVGTGTALIPIELCRRPQPFQITAVDLSCEMINVAEQNVRAAKLEDRIVLRRLDAKDLPFGDGSFDAVVSNSIIHHIPEPRACLAEMVRVTATGGLLFVRDLLRPATEAEVEQLVRTYAGDANDHQRAMFGNSLRAALTVPEVRALAVEFGIPNICVAQTTDRHWTLAWTT
jgi:SAM-dependent methyltransferase